MLSSVATCFLRFAIALHLHLRAEHEHRNIVCSPFSTGTALSMTAFGAAGNTSKQLLHALHLTHCSNGVDEHLKAQMGNLSKNSAKMFLLSADRLYVDTTFKIRDTYRLLLERFFEASVELADFKNNAAEVRSEINSWVSDQTGSKVRHLVPHGSVDNGTTMVLINALYFKALWKMPFTHARRKTFSRDAQRETDVVMMHRHGKFRFAYVDELLSIALELPYKGERCSMVIFLPYDVDGLPSVEERLSEDALRSAFSQLNPGEVALTMPKFKIDFRPDLKHTLQRLGVRDLFRPGVADLSGMVESGDIWLSEIFHEAYFQVDEDGTESAAGLSESAGALASGPPPDPSTLTYIDVDHPFLFVVRDNVQDVILFMGTLKDPAEHHY
ncbi:hypothetical protein MTO96_011183 [Rhipicephalus appendiculatus]